MKKVKNPILLLPILGVLALLTLLIIPACKKTSGGGGAKAFTINGTVLNEFGAAIQGALVKTGSSSATSGSDGSFTLTNVSSGQSSFQIEADAAGYFTQYKNITNIDGSSLGTQIVLLQKTTLGTMSGKNGGSIGQTGLRVIAPTNGFANADGSVYSGQVTVSSRYVNGNSPLLQSAMPGGDFLAKDASGNDGAMLSYGFVVTDFNDANGNKLTPNPGVRVAVTVPPGISNPVNDGAQSWGYNNVSGKWENGSNITQTGSEFFYPATTLCQNIDKFVLGFGTIEGQVVCPNGTPLKYVQVTLQSTNYNNKYVTTTNENGKYRASVACKDGAVVFSYNASSAAGGSVSVGTVTVGNTVQAPAITSSTCPTNSVPPPNGSGQFSLGGNSYSGTCGSVPDIYGCSGVDVIILTSSGVAFDIYDMPTASSGSYSFTDGYQNVSTCNLYGLTSAINGTQYATQSGTLTKTGTTSFTFSCTVYDIISNTSYAVTGSGTF